MAGSLARRRLRAIYSPFACQARRAAFRTSKNEAFARLAELRSPTLALWGEKDTMVPLSELEKLKTVLPTLSSHIIKGAAHCPMETHMSTVADILLVWLAGQD